LENWHCKKCLASKAILTDKELFLHHEVTLNFAWINTFTMCNTTLNCLPMILKVILKLPLQFLWNYFRGANELLGLEVRLCSCFSIGLLFSQEIMYFYIP